MTALMLSIFINIFATDFSSGGIYYTVLSEEDGTCAVIKPNGTDPYSGDVTIPEEVSFMGKTFKVISVYDNAFMSSRDVTSVVLPSSIETIGISAFDGCKNMTSITLSENIHTIGTNAFYECSALTSIELPANLTEIGEYAMQCCSSLKTVKIPENITTLPKGLFSECYALNEIELPSNLKKIDNFAFYSCTSLQKIEIPNSVTTIGKEAFSSCYGLTNVVIGSAVTEIGELAFYDDESITDIKCLSATPVQFSTDGEGPGFSDMVYWFCNLTVPKGSIDAYKEAEYWKNFDNISEAEDETEDPETATVEGTYLMFAKSAFDSEGNNAYTSGGVPVKHEVEVASSAEKKTIEFYNLFETEYEGTAKGTYDPAAGTAEIKAPILNEMGSNDLDAYQKVGEYGEYDIVLSAAEAYGIGYIKAIENLDMRITDNGTAIIPQSGMAGAMMQKDGVFAGYIYMIYDIKMFKIEDGTALHSDSSTVNFGRSYAGNTYTKKFTLYNSGMQGSDYVISCEGKGFSAKTPTGFIESGNYKEIEVSFTPDGTGSYSGTLTIYSEGKDITIQLASVCEDQPDYSTIVKEGEFTFSTVADYPWVIDTENYDRTVAVSTNKGMEKTISSMTAFCEVPSTQKGILTWRGYYDPYFSSSDAFYVMVDNEKAYEDNGRKGNASGKLELAPGKHEITFVYDKGVKVEGPFEKGEDYTYIYDLSLVYQEMEENNAEMTPKSIDFGKMLISETAPEATASKTVTFENTGYGDFRILEVTSENGFSGIVPEWTLKPLKTNEMTLNFSASETGKYEGNISIKTTAGTFNVACKAEVDQMPDYQAIVKEGNFIFNANPEYPFVVEGNTAYNITSKVADQTSTISYFTASFDVPRGQWGFLSWKGQCSTNEFNENQNNDTGMIMIDDGQIVSQNYYGESCADYNTLPVNCVHLPEGTHNITFAYIQSGNNMFSGEDRLTISELSLVCKTLNDNEIDVWGTKDMDFGELQLTKAMKKTVTLYNKGNEYVSILSIEGDGPFNGANFDTESKYGTFEEIPVGITFIPEKEGEFSGVVTIRTTAGDIKVNCTGSSFAKEGILFEEDFENDLSRWKFIDNDGDGTTWMISTHPDYCMSGTRALAGYSYNQKEYEGEIDDIAISPDVRIPGNGAILNFYVNTYDQSIKDYLEVMIGEGQDTDIEEYDTVIAEDIEVTGKGFVEYQLSLNEYAGKTVNIAFRHKKASSFNILMIDDMIVKEQLGVNNTENCGTVKSVEYFSIEGMKLAKKEKGLIIEKTTMTDGSMKVRKIIVE